MSRSASLIGLAVALALSACSGESKSPGPRADADGGLRFGSLVFKPCSLSVASVAAVEAQCATLAVPEDHAAPTGRKIELAIALVPAKGQATPDPILMIAGGPGQSALESYPQVHGAFADARRNRNVLLVDARGTGGSHPLKCADAEGESAVMEEDDFSADAARAFAERCRDTLSKTSDLRHYGTADHVRDLERVRNALGVAQYNLVGISYGTRVAQQYARRHPAATRTVLLDSVVPNTLALGQDHARNLEAALKLQFALCAADAACTRNLGEPAQALAQVRTRLKAGNLAPVRYRDPTSGEWREETPAFGHLALLLRLYAYQPQAAAMLPLVVHEASEGRFEGLLAQARSIQDSVSDSIMHGMQLSVSCTEDVAGLTVDEADSASVLGTDMITFTKAQCEAWPRGTRDPGFSKPLTGNVPVLALSGQFDPVTPPRYGDDVIRHLPRGRHLVLPGQGHNVIGIGCMPKLFAQFVESADAKTLDAGCLKRLAPTPPFAGTYGWEP